MNPLDVRAEDFAPGDRRRRDFSWDGIALHQIRSTNHPLFEKAFETLWKEFGEAGEMETREVIERRLWRWESGGGADAGEAFCGYELIVAEKNGEILAVRDHTVILLAPHCVGGFFPIVHLSHNLVAPEWRRTGLAAWMRAFPVASARRLAVDRESDRVPHILLLAEMEPPDPQRPPTLIRLKAYEKAGFLKVDSRRLRYLQPDFREPREIDATGVRPVPMQLILRAVGKEELTVLDASLLRDALDRLYAMYELEFRPQDVVIARQCLDALPHSGSPETLDLVAPTAAP